MYSLEEDLKITDNQYLIALTIFFFSYAFFEVCGSIQCSQSDIDGGRPGAFVQEVMVEGAE